jgi:hypothetical protein
MPSVEASEFSKIAILENSIEAQLVCSILDQHSIPHRLRSYYDTAYDGLFQLQKGWGELWAPARHREEIRKLLDDVRSDLKHEGQP